MNLISTSSRTYAGRLIKEIKDVWMSGAGVYYDRTGHQFPSNPRVSAIRYSKKSHTIICQSNLGQFSVLPSEWDESFCDGYGRNIHASRHQP
jgi:hypothetical protein